MKLDLQVIMSWILYSGVIGGAVLLLVMSGFIRDYKFITETPFRFVAELVVVALVIPFIYTWIMTTTRSYPIKEANLWFYSLAIKFGVYHILFQLTGIYTIMFSL